METDQVEGWGGGQTATIVFSVHHKYAFKGGLDKVSFKKVIVCKNFNETLMK